MDIISGWLTTPDASAGLFVAAIAGIFAVYQLRAMPAERRGRILKAMTKQYALSAEERGRALRELPRLVDIGYTEIYQAIISEIARIQTDMSDSPDGQFEHLRKLEQEATTWIKPKLGISYTSAHEILGSEFKFRAFMWCIETIRDDEQRDAIGISEDLLEASRRAIEKINIFAMEYENGAYPPRSMMGQMHKSLATTAKALEPLVWEGKGKEGRWGRRIVRLGVAAEHYNDVTSIHRISDITWTAPDKDDIIVHPALTIPAFGKEIVDTTVPDVPLFLSLPRLKLRAQYWKLVGGLGLRPRAWWAYGGRRLRQHMHAEDKLAPALNFAIANRCNGDLRASLNFGWALADLPQAMTEGFKRLRSDSGGRLGGLVAKRRS